MNGFMIVMIVDGKQSATFADDLYKAEAIKSNCECGLGGYAEIYVRRDIIEDGVRVGAEYQFLEA